MRNSIIQNVRYLFLIIILLSLSFFTINYYVISFWEKFLYPKNSKLDLKVWLILWAWIKNNSQPSDILKDRLDTWVEAYKNKLISKIIVSWDNSKINYNEPEVMEKYLLKKWVLKKDIFKDYAWFDTYDSIYRAKNIFWVKKMLIFTQKYHLYRALYISNNLWIDSYWMVSDKHIYLNMIWFKFRELFSRVKAFLEVEILKSKPKFLWKKIKIN